MAEPQFLTPRTRIGTLDVSQLRSVLWLSGYAFLALVILYVVGLDQGAISIFGSDRHIHEFVHDARHLLGFPCH
jgi:Probable cobalt transporter subunit (CbtB)